jgi:hypothetical protein
MSAPQAVPASLREALGSGTLGNNLRFSTSATQRGSRLYRGHRARVLQAWLL